MRKDSINFDNDEFFRVLIVSQLAEPAWNAYLDGGMNGLQQFIYTKAGGWVSGMGESVNWDQLVASLKQTYGELRILYKGIPYGQVDEAQVEHVMRNAKMFVMEQMKNEDITSGWTDHASLAYNWALGRDWEGWQSDEPPEEQYDVGIVLEAEVPTGSYLEAEDGGQVHGEVWIDQGTPVTLLYAYLYSVDTETGDETYQKITLGDQHTAATGDESGTRSEEAQIKDIVDSLNVPCDCGADNLPHEWNSEYCPGSPVPLLSSWKDAARPWELKPEQTEQMQGLGPGVRVYVTELKEVIDPSNGDFVDWEYSEPDITVIDFDPYDPEEPPMKQAVDWIINEGLTEGNGDDYYYSPDGAEQNYRTGDYWEESAALIGFSDAELEQIATAVDLGGWTQYLDYSEGSWKTTHAFNPRDVLLDPAVINDESKPHRRIKDFVKKLVHGALEKHTGLDSNFFDLYLAGPAVSYRYSPTSDLDVHVVPAYAELPTHMDKQEIHKHLNEAMAHKVDGAYLPGSQHRLHTFVARPGQSPDDLFGPTEKPAYSLADNTWYLSPSRQHETDSKALTHQMQRAESIKHKLHLLKDNPDLAKSYEHFLDSRAKDEPDYFSEPTSVLRHVKHAARPWEQGELPELNSTWVWKSGSGQHRLFTIYGSSPDHIALAFREGNQGVVHFTPDEWAGYVRAGYIIPSNGQLHIAARPWEAKPPEELPRQQSIPLVGETFELLNPRSGVWTPYEVAAVPITGKHFMILAPDGTSRWYPLMWYSQNLEKGYLRFPKTARRPWEEKRAPFPEEKGAVAYQFPDGWKITITHPEDSGQAGLYGYGKNEILSNEAIEYDLIDARGDNRAEISFNGPGDTENYPMPHRMMEGSAEGGAWTINYVNERNSEASGYKSWDRDPTVAAHLKEWFEHMKQWGMSFDTDPIEEEGPSISTPRELLEWHNGELDDTPADYGLNHVGPVYFSQPLDNFAEDCLKAVLIGNEYQSDYRDGGVSDEQGLAEAFIEAWKIEQESNQKPPSLTAIAESLDEQIIERFQDYQYQNSEWWYENCKDLFKQDYLDKLPPETQQELSDLEEEDYYGAYPERIEELWDEQREEETAIYESVLDNVTDAWESDEPWRSGFKFVQTIYELAQQVTPTTDPEHTGSWKTAGDLKVIYNVEKDHILLGTTAIGHGDRIIGTYDGNVVHLEQPVTQWLNQDYFKKLWRASFPKRPLRGVHVRVVN